MKKNNTEFLKECMSNALVRLLKEKPLEKISIIEITKKACVGRATWFRNFSSKEEALTYRIITLWYIWCEKHNISQEQRYTVHNALDFFNFSLEYKDLYKLMYIRELQTTIYEAFYQVIIKQHRSSPSEYYKSRFLSYGVYGIVDEWVKRDFRESPEELADILYQTIKAAET